MGTSLLIAPVGIEIRWTNQFICGLKTFNRTSRNWNITEYDAFAYSVLAFNRTSRNWNSKNLFMSAAIVGILLIAPVGIEMTHYLRDEVQFFYLLIAPVGIEIRISRLTRIITELTFNRTSRNWNYDFTDNSKYTDIPFNRTSRNWNVAGSGSTLVAATF